jgi:hypothetical protein
MDDLEITDKFVLGSKNHCTTDLENKEKPYVVRGIVKKDAIYSCQNIQRDYYYIDTGYVGNFPCANNPSGKKLWHRVVKNGLQHHELRPVPEDRWDSLIKQDPRLKWRGWKNYDKKILLVLPNPKACKFYNVDFDTWTKETTEKIKRYSDLPIEVRVKGSRSERNHGYSIYEAFDSGVYATVSFNSIASLESVLYGIPSFVSVPCAASLLSSDDLRKLSNPYFPSEDLIYKQACNLSYGQFTVEEIENGDAFKILERYL